MNPIRSRMLHPIRSRHNPINKLVTWSWRVLIASLIVGLGNLAIQLQSAAIASEQRAALAVMDADRDVKTLSACLNGHPLVSEADSDGNREYVHCYTQITAIPAVIKP